MMDSLEQLTRRALRIPFVTLVHAIERVFPKAARVGGLGPFYDEPVQFRHDPSLIFHSSDIAGATFKPTTQRRAQHVEVVTTFSGLSGAVSPLPPHFAEQILQAEDQAAVQREFLDVFHHRFLGLFYRGLLKVDAPRSFEHGEPDRISRLVLLLAGLSPEHAERTTGLSLARLLRLAPLLACYPANEERLAVALRDIFQPQLGERGRIEVAAFAGGYVSLERADRPRLGRDLRLGSSSVLGGRVRAPGSAVRVAITGLEQTVCREFAPGGACFDELQAVASLLTPPGIHVRVELSPTQTVQARLSKRNGARLGRETWLGRRGQPAPIRFRIQREMDAH